MKRLKHVIAAVLLGVAAFAAIAGPIVIIGGSGRVVVSGGGGGSFYALPADRMTTWQPGVTYNGGIPARTTICSNISAGSSVATIQSALDSCPSGQTVLLAAGTYTVNSLITVPSNVTLRGAGPTSTILQKTNGAVAGVDSPGASADPLIMLTSSRFSNTGPIQHGFIASTNLTSDGVKGANTITVASASGFSVGMMVIVDERSNATFRTDHTGRGQILASPDYRIAYNKHNPAGCCDDPIDATDLTSTATSGPNDNQATSWFNRQDRPTGEMKVISNISGTTITFSTPLHISYRTAQTAQMARLEMATVSNAGVESLAMTGGSNGALRIQWCNSCWAKDIEISTWRDEGIAIDSSFRAEVRHSYIHDVAYASPGGAGYAISFSAGSSDSLIEDNIVVRANKVMVSRAAGAGSVVGYNYMDQGYIIYDPNWIEMGVNGSHMVGPHHMLFEGNYTFNLDSDKTHGNSVYQTYYRNYAKGRRKTFTTQSVTINDYTSGASARTAGPAATAYYFSFVGNVLGESGQMSAFGYERNIMTQGSAVWSVGWDDWTPQPMDDDIINYLIRDGNYDYLTGQVHWHGMGGSGSGNGLTPPSPSTLPDSLYLSSKPAFMGSYTWPWVDATGATKLYLLPARERFEAGTYFAGPP